MNRADWALLITSAVLTAYVLYIVLSDDEDNTARVAYYRALADAYQSIAHHFGAAGIRAELQYHKALELGRMI
jgi:hypothetical protein